MDEGVIGRQQRQRALGYRSVAVYRGGFAMTVASGTMDGSVERGTPASTRGLGILAIATGIAGFALLAAHPGGDAKTFADVVKGEAANQTMDALVHGGFVVVLALQLICYAAFSRRFGYRISALAAFVFFAIGTAFLCASLLLDGLVTPALAARYVAKPDKIESARVLFVLIGTMVSFLMPIGLAFQCAAIATWGWALSASGSRVLGGVGLGLGVLLLVALGTSFVTMNPLVLMGGIAATALWAILVGAQLLRAQS
jgi:hypothetical protein